MARLLENQAAGAATGDAAWIHVALVTRASVVILALQPGARVPMGEGRADEDSGDMARQECSIRREAVRRPPPVPS